ncbi:MAG: methyltransferase domain-containing protein [Bdellovibrionaceae bacterium]|nr:methyltransferase domain-containing protein [Pseudobdellovibrionaceae bacterium]
MIKRLLKTGLNSLPLPISSALYARIKGVPVRTTHPKYKHILKAASALKTRVEKLNVEDLNISDYSKDYLKDIQTNSAACLTKFVGVISHALPNDFSPETQFLDYGGGTGLITFLAAELGVNVTYNDLFETSCRDLIQIAKALSPNQYPHIVAGGIEAVAQDAKTRNVSYDAVGSYDVIEHIYAPTEFYAGIAFVVRSGAKVYMATSANSFNAKTVAELSTIQNAIDGGPHQRVRPDGTCPAYFELRRNHCQDLIRKRGISLEQREIEDLAVRTRGLTLEDIGSGLDEFLNNAKKTAQDAIFPSNTCDPLTGNWTEHLIDYPRFLSSLSKVWANKTVYPESPHLRRTSHVIGISTQKV